MEELRYENMDFQNVCDVLFLHISKDIDEPFEVFVWWTYPQEVYLQWKWESITLQQEEFFHKNKMS